MFVKAAAAAAIVVVAGDSDKGCVSWPSLRYDAYHDVCLAITILIAI